MKIELLFCPLGCDYVRSGDRERESFRCHYCERPLVSEKELDEIDAGLRPIPEIVR